MLKNEEMARITPNRGDIFYIVDTKEEVGSEQAAGRPAVVISSPAGCSTSAVVTVAYLTTQAKANMAVHVPINSAKKPSIVLCEQIFTVSKTRLGNLEGHVTDNEMQKINKGVSEALGLFGASSGMTVCETYGEEILEKANKHIGKIVEVASRIAEAKQAIGSISSGSVIDRRLESLLSEKDKAEIRNCAIEAVYKKKLEIVSEMENLIGISKKTAIAKESQGSENVETEVTADIKGKQKKSSYPIDMTKEAVSKMYVDEGMGRKQVAEHFGITEVSLNNFMCKYGIKRKK